MNIACVADSLKPAIGKSNAVAASRHSGVRPKGRNDDHLRADYDRTIPRLSPRVVDPTVLVVNSKVERVRASLREAMIELGGGGLLPQRFQTSRQGLWVSWLAQLATKLGEPGDGLARELRGGEGGAMEVVAMEGGATEVRVQTKRIAAVWGHLGVSEAGLEQEVGDGGLLLPLLWHGRELGKWGQVRMW